MSGLKDSPFKLDLVPTEHKMALFARKEAAVDSFLTPWSIVHFFSGGAAKALGVTFWQNFLFHGMYELKDNFDSDFIYNSTLNSIGDQAMSMLGHHSAKVGDQLWFYLWLITWGGAIYSGEAFG